MTPITVTSQYEDYFRQETGWSGLLYKCANAKYAHKLARARSSDLVRHARAERRDRRLCARMRDGRARGCAQARSARASPALLFRSRSEQRSAVQQQGAARMLPPGRRGVRLGQAQSRAALDAGRQRPGRLGHGDRRLGCVAGADHGAHRCSAPTAMPRSRARPPTSAPAPTPSWRRSRPTCSGCRSTTSASSSAIRACRNRRSKADHGLRPRCRTASRRRPTRSATSCCVWPSRCQIRRLRTVARRRRARGRQAGEQARRVAFGFDRRCHAARRRGPHRAGERPPTRAMTPRAHTTLTRRSLPR